MPTHHDVLEAVLVHCWKSALRRQEIGVHDNFFVLGGHSLAAMRIANRLRKIFDVPVDYLQVMESSTVAALAENLRGCGIPASVVDRAAREYLLANGLDTGDRAL